MEDTGEEGFAFGVHVSRGGGVADEQADLLLAQLLSLPSVTDDLPPLQDPVVAESTHLPATTTTTPHWMDMDGQDAYHGIDDDEDEEYGGGGVIKMSGPGVCSSDEGEEQVDLDSVPWRDVSETGELPTALDTSPVELASVTRWDKQLLQIKSTCIVQCAVCSVQ
eukprot:TRINITY_DN3038_c0_g1_i1.p2 TRINITY_DN3038_c0_g1~~TRINITY_DN3038_c0_g1_i1.p2  ORF type:complete len:165 (+),score=38.96 TRINITY_DN3038_c0_g1_i1:90-584(+)